MRIVQYYPYTAASSPSRTGDDRSLGSARRSASRAFGTIARPRAVGATSPNERSSARARKAEAREHPVNRMTIRSRNGSIIRPSRPARSTSCAVFPRHLRARAPKSSLNAIPKNGRNTCRPATTKAVWRCRRHTVCANRKVPFLSRTTNFSKFAERFKKHLYVSFESL